MSPKLIYGTATFGMDVTGVPDVEAAKSVLQAAHEMGIGALDTAPRYPPLKPGRAEQLVGEAIGSSNIFNVDSKVYADTKTDGSGELARTAMEKSVHDSLERLKRPKGLTTLYAHRPDPATPLAEQIKNFNEQIAQGHCKAWGLSNHSPAVVDEIMALCEQNGWQKPSAYQGDYNVITRGMETKLLPILRAHGTSFVAFRSLGAGFLTGNFINNQQQGTRMAADNPLGQAMQKVYGGEELHQAVRQFDGEVKAQGLSSLEVAIRWIAHHSALGDDDAIILGASKETQLRETVALLQKGPLPAAVVALAERLWATVEPFRNDVL